jgi:hypothetical protein
MRPQVFLTHLRKFCGKHAMKGYYLEREVLTYRAFCVTYQQVAPLLLNVGTIFELLL